MPCQFIFCLTFFESNVRNVVERKFPTHLFFVPHVCVGGPPVQSFNTFPGNASERFASLTRVGKRTSWHMQQVPQGCQTSRTQSSHKTIPWLERPLPHGIRDNMQMEFLLRGGSNRNHWNAVRTSHPLLTNVRPTRNHPLQKWVSEAHAGLQLSKRVAELRHLDHGLGSTTPHLH